MNKIKIFLETHSKSPISDLQFLGEGCFSRAYSYIQEGQAFVLRLNEGKSDFIKDALIYDCLKNPAAPVPQVLKMGTFDELYFYCITERLPGITYNDLSLEEKEAVLPAIFDALEAIHHLDISHTTGFGLIDENGNGQFPSWPAALLNLENHKIPYDFESLYGRPYFDRLVFDQYLDMLQNLASCLPEKRFFVHGDFGFDNILIQEGRVTGVIDWGEARIGDPAYDVAWLDYWSDDIPLAERLLSLCAQRSIYPDKIYERLLACSLHIGLGSLLFSTHFDNEKDYHDAGRRLHRAVDRFQKNN